MAFDAPSREECAADRSLSNTPLQALTLLNDPTYVEAARGFAKLILNSGETDTGRRLDFAFRRASSRTPRLRNAKCLRNCCKAGASTSRATRRRRESAFGRYFRGARRLGRS